MFGDKIKDHKLMLKMLLLVIL